MRAPLAATAITTLRVACAHGSADRPRIASTTDVGGLQSVAFRNADDGSKVLIVVITGTADVAFSVRSRGVAFQYGIPAGAVATSRWT
jgi:glucosylceramidase